MLRIYHGLFFFLLLVPSLIFAQQIDSIKSFRPKVGLVLSGGGAKGFAHIGVIKVLEEAGIRPDFVGGTSMGSIIGGLYALGYDSESMKRLIAKVNWDELLNDKISRRDLSIEEKSEDGRYIFSFPFRRSHFEMPAGLRSGQNISNLLSKLTSPAYRISKFDQLPIPFYCVAADIEKGESVLLNSGYLADAMRASMSIPTLFTPIEIDNKLLVDGGLFNNYPADIMKKQGADIIIGVDVQRTLFTKKELHSIKRVVEQMGNFLRNQTTLDNRKITDYLIQPEVTHFSITDFNSADSIIDIGERAARKMLPSLLKLVDTLNTMGPAPKKVSLADMNDQLIVKAIRYEGLKNVPERVVQNRLDIYVGDTISIDDLSKAIDRTYASQYFDIVTYKLEPKDDGVCLVVRLIEKNYGIVKLGIHYDSDFEASLLFNAVFRNVLFNGSKLSVDFGLGRNPRFSFEYYLNNGRWPNIGTSIKTNTLDVYNYDQDGNKTASYRYSEMLIDLFAETIISNSMVAGFGGQFEMSSLRKAISPLSLGDVEQAFFNLYAYYKIDTYDRAFFPRKGGSLWIEGKLVNGINKRVADYDAATIITLKYRNAFKISNKLTIAPSLNIGAAIADSLPFQHHYFIGGANFGESRQLFPFMGMNLMQHSDYSALVLGCDLQYEFHRNHFLILKYSIGRTARKAESLFNISSDFQGVGLTYGYNSPIGPIELSLMVSNNTKKVLSFINLGYWF